MATGPAHQAGPQRRPWLAPALIAAAILVAAVIFVGASLRRPTIDTFTVTAPDPVEVGDVLVGPRIYTIEAVGPDAWSYFDFSRGSAVEPDGPRGWDLAFRRFGIMANGGPGFAGDGGIADLGPIPFDSVIDAPVAGYAVTAARADSVNPAIERWYDYGFTSHILSSKRHVYVIRTADGRFAKLVILGYYCAGATPGCITFQYVYQGDGSRSLEPAGPATVTEVDPAG